MWRSASNVSALARILADGQGDGRNTRTDTQGWVSARVCIHTQPFIWFVGVGAQGSSGLLWDKFPFTNFVRALKGITATHLSTLGKALKVCSLICNPPNHMAPSEHHDALELAMSGY